MVQTLPKRCTIICTDWKSLMCNVGRETVHEMSINRRYGPDPISSFSQLRGFKFGHLIDGPGTNRGTEQGKQMRYRSVDISRIVNVGFSHQKADMWSAIHPYWQASIPLFEYTAAMELLEEAICLWLSLNRWRTSADITCFWLFSNDSDIFHSPDTSLRAQIAVPFVLYWFHSQTL